MNRGAIILCGGRSARMGRDKALLPFGPHETLLERVVRIVGEVVPLGQVMCVAAKGQQLPTLPTEVRVVEDEAPDGGPLAALVTGLSALQGEADAVFVSGCDAPLLEPPFVQQLFELLGAHQAAVPCVGAQIYPLPAVYSVDVLSPARMLLARGERSLQALVVQSKSTRIDGGLFRGFDPNLNSLVNCNSPQEYEMALAAAFPRGTVP